MDPRLLELLRKKLLGDEAGQESPGLSGPQQRLSPQGPASPVPEPPRAIAEAPPEMPPRAPEPLEAATSQGPNLPSAEPGMMDRLKEMMSKRDSQNAQDLFARGADTFGRGLSGADPDPDKDYWKDKRAMNDQPIKDMGILEKLKARQAGAGPLNPSQRAILQKYGIEVGAGSTMDDLKLLRVGQAKRKQDFDERKLDEYYKPRGYMAGARERRMGAKDAWARQQRDEPSDTMTKQIGDLDRSLMLLENIEQRKSTVNTGPIMSLVAQGRKLVGLDDPETTAFASRLGRELAEELHRVSGTAVSDPEFIRQKAQRLTMSLQDGSFDQVLDELIEQLKKEKLIKLESIRRSGKDPRGHLAPNQGFDPERSAPFEVPRDNEISDAQWGPAEDSGRPLNIPDQSAERKYVNGKWYQKVPGGWEEEGI